MIKNFRHKGLENFYQTGCKAGIQVDHAAKLRILLTAMDAAGSPSDLEVPINWRLHKLKGKKYKDYWSLTVNGNWRVIFEFEDTNVIRVDYLDYHSER